MDYPGGTSLKFTYNVLGQRTQSVDQTGFTVNYIYDSLERLSKLTDVHGNLIVQYTYDSVGNLVGKDMGNGTHTTYTYNADAQLLSSTNFASVGGPVNSSDAYTYDPLGNLLTDTNQDGEWVYTYDADSQLIHAVFTPNNTDPDGLTSQDLQYVYDAAGNRISETMNGVITTYTVNNVNEYTASVTSGVTTTYQYDPTGNLISAANSSGTTNYTFNDANELTAISASGLTASYGYNAFGSLDAQTVNGVATSYLVDPVEIGAIVAATTAGNTVDFTYGLGQTSEVVGGTNAANYYDFGIVGQHDPARSPTTPGTYVNSYAYLPFGQTTALTATLSNPFTFVGQAGALSIAGGLTNMRARNYNAATGQFVSNDPINIFGGDTNIRRYVSNAPTLNIDPTGLCDNAFSNVGLLGTGAGFAGSGADLAKNGGTESRGAELASASKKIGWRSCKRTAGVFEAASKSFKQLQGGHPDAVQAGGYLSQVYSNGQFNGTAAAGAAYYGAMAALDLEGIANPLVGLGVAVARPFLDHYIEEQLKEAEDSKKESPEGPESDGPDGDTGNEDPADPNALIGPSGYALPAANLSYTIDFENDGTAAAQVVPVTEQLSANLNWSTFQLGSFGFGPINVTIPAGLTQYRTTINYQNADGSALNVIVALDFNVQTGVLTATLTSLDPAARQEAPTGVFDGFLLPRRQHPCRRRGFVQYTVQPLATLPTGAAINQQASVVFDTNAALATNITSNVFVALLNPTTVSEPEGTTAPTAVTISSLLGSTISSVLTNPYSDSDPDGAANTKPGIAVIGAFGGGTWQYSTNGTTCVVIPPSISTASALLLPHADQLRFMPTTNVSGTAKLYFVAWDGSQGKAGGTFNVVATGGTTPFSISAGDLNVTVSPAPLWVGTGAHLDSILPGTYSTAANAALPVGTTVSTIFGPYFHDDNAAVTVGVAVTKRRHLDRNVAAHRATAARTGRRFPRFSRRRPCCCRRRRLDSLCAEDEHVRRRRIVVGPGLGRQRWHAWGQSESGDLEQDGVPAPRRSALPPRPVNRLRADLGRCQCQRKPPGRRRRDQHRAHGRHVVVASTLQRSRWRNAAARHRHHRRNFDVRHRPIHAARRSVDAAAERVADLGASAAQHGIAAARGRPLSRDRDFHFRRLG